MIFRRQTPRLWLAEPMPGCIWMIRLEDSGYRVSDGRQWREGQPRYDHLPQAIAAAERAFFDALVTAAQRRAA